MVSILNWQFILACTLSIMFAVHIDIDPKTDQYVLENTSFTINCTASSNTTLDPTLLEVVMCFVNQTCHPIRSYVKEVSLSHLIYHVSHADSENDGLYSCRYNTTNSSFIHFFIISIPALPAEFSCKSLDRDRMTCLWNGLKQQRAKNNVTIQYKYGDYLDVLPCPQMIQNGCHWPSRSETTDKSIKIFEYFQSNIEIYLMAENVVAKDNKTFKFNISNIVQLSTMALKKVNVTDKALTISWDLPSTFVFNCHDKSTVTRLNITSKWNDPQHIVITSSDKSPVFTFSGLSPFTTYNITMKARPQSSFYWSNTSSLMIKTLAAVPGALPFLLPSSYYVCSEDKRPTETGNRICIVLKTISEKDIHSDHAYFTVTIQLDGITMVTNTSSQDSIVTIAKLKPSLKTYRIKVQSYNDIGYHNASSDVIFKRTSSDEQIKPSLVLVHIDSNGNHNISWITDSLNSQQIDRVVVYWGREVKNINQFKCNFDYKEVLGNEISTSVKLDSSAGTEWIYAVAFITPSGGSSGMVFAEKNCVFRYSEIGPIQKPDFALNGQQNDTNVLVISHLKDYCSFNDIPLKYNIYYKAIADGRKRINCSLIKSLGSSIEVNVIPKFKHTVIDDLTTGTWYAVCLNILLADGETTTDSDVYFAKTSKAASGPSSGNHLAVGYQVLIAILSIVVCAFVMGLVIWIIKSRYDSVDVKITIPEISNRHQYKQIEEKDNTALPADDSGHASSVPSNTSSEDNSLNSKHPYCKIDFTSEDSDEQKYMQIGVKDEENTIIPVSVIPVSVIPLEIISGKPFSGKEVPREEIHLENIPLKTIATEETKRQISDEGFEDGTSSNPDLKSGIHPTVVRQFLNSDTLNKNVKEDHDIQLKDEIIDNAFHKPFQEVESSIDSSGELGLNNGRHNSVSSSCHHGYVPVNINSDSSGDYSSNSMHNSSGMNDDFMYNSSVISDDSVDSYVKCNTSRNCS